MFSHFHYQHGFHSQRASHSSVSVVSAPQHHTTAQFKEYAGQFKKMWPSCHDLHLLFHTQSAESAELPFSNLVFSSFNLVSLSFTLTGSIDAEPADRSGSSAEMNLNGYQQMEPLKNRIYQH